MINIQFLCYRKKDCRLKLTFTEFIPQMKAHMHPYPIQMCFLEFNVKRTLNAQLTAIFKWPIQCLQQAIRTLFPVQRYFYPMFITQEVRKRAKLLTTEAYLLIFSVLMPRFQLKKETDMHSYCYFSFCVLPISSGEMSATESHSRRIRDVLFG